MNKIFFWVLGAMFLITACQKETIIPIATDDLLLVIPEGFPEVVFPLDNEFNSERWALGKKLFYDPVLSRDSSISCASCHFPEKAFSDTVTFSLGVEDRGGTRNAPSLGNIAYHPYFTREGGVPTLEMQVLVPIQEHNEFDFNIVLIAEKLQKDTSYQRMSQEAYARDMDPFVITRSIANFERSFLTGNSRYDQFVFQGNNNSLTEAEKRGMDLFFSDQTGCTNCHSDFNFTNYAFENNGLYEDYVDPGRFRLTGEEEDRAKFKVPSLRNVELTGPYMHDGSLESLEAVVEHYNTGGKNHFNQSGLVRPLNLTDVEKSEIVLFLKALTDISFTSNPIFKN